MEFNVGVISYAITAFVFGLLCVLLLTRWKGRFNSALFFLFCFVSAIWAVSAAIAAENEYSITLVVILTELCRDLVWSIFLVRLITILNPECHKSSFFRMTRNMAYAVPLFLIVLVIVVKGVNLSVPSVGFEIRVMGQVLIAILGLTLIEQVCRNAGNEIRWSLKFFCFGVGTFYAFDFYLYSDALLFRRMDYGIWFSRPWVYLVALGLIFIAVSRNPILKSNLSVSRAVVFYTTAFVLTGIYLLVMSAGGLYLQQFGGDWGVVASTSFIFTALLFLVVLFASGDVRARLRVFIDKHFLDYKYDYREQWLGLIRELSLSDESSKLEKRALYAITEMMDSVGGSLWVRKNQQEFTVVSEILMDEVVGVAESTNGSLTNYLENWQWVVNLQEYEADPNLYADLALPEWLARDERCWLVVPLMLQSRLYGFIVLLQPNVARDFNWEDIDLLKTAGRQVAIHLAQDRAALALVQSRQFEAFNRFSAYVVHDLKNLVSQLALVVKNAEKHKHNPAFMDDAISTVDNSVERMNRLLAQLRAGAVESEADGKINLKLALEATVKEKSGGLPLPVLGDVSVEYWLKGNESRFISILGHLIQNAQDATANSGFVRILVQPRGTTVILIIEDNGGGMEQTFIENRLFKPFDTTKGLTGMGIGAHESRALIEEMHGSIDVESEIGKGTKFIICLPLLEKPA